MGASAGEGHGLHFEKLDSRTQECAQGSQPPHEAETRTGTRAGAGAVPPRGPEVNGGPWGGGLREEAWPQEQDGVRGAAGLATVAGETGEGLMAEQNG